MSSLPQTAEALATLTRSNAERDILLLSQAGRRIRPGRPGDLVAAIFGDAACGVSEGALRIRATLTDVARDLFIRQTGSGESFEAQFSLSQARWQGEGGNRPVTLLEGTTLATAVGRGISILQSGEPLPGRVAGFLPQTISAELAHIISALGRLVPEGGNPFVVLERPLQGCTCVATVAAGEGETGAAVEGANDGAVGAGIQSPSTAGAQGGGFGSDAFACPVCYQDRPPADRLSLPCCRGLLCAPCTTEIMRVELEAVRVAIRASGGRPNGGMRGRRQRPFPCPFCRRRSRIADGAPGDPMALTLRSPAPASPAIIDVAASPGAPAPARPGRRAPNAAVEIHYSPVYCAVLNYAALPQESRPLALRVALDETLNLFAQRHWGRLGDLIRDGRRLFAGWGQGAVAALSLWREQAGAAGYAGQNEQEAARLALEAVGGIDAQEFWLGFDMQGPEFLQGYLGARGGAVPRLRIRPGAGAGRGAPTQPPPPPPPPVRVWVS
jgi:hypothetical protein